MFVCTLVSESASTWSARNKKGQPISVHVNRKFPGERIPSVTSATGGQVANWVPLALYPHAHRATEGWCLDAKADISPVELKMQIRFLSHCNHMLLVIRNVGVRIKCRSTSSLATRLIEMRSDKRVFFALS